MIRVGCVALRSAHAWSPNWARTRVAVDSRRLRFGSPEPARSGVRGGLGWRALGGGVLVLNMLLGEVAPGGAGAGLYGILVMAVLAVFLAGLMVGRTPEYLGRKIRRREITFAALYVLAMPFAVLLGTGLALGFPGPRETILNAAPHGLTEVLYAYASAANNNGSAFAGLGTDTVFYNTTLGLAMLIGRYLPIVFVLALAGSLARQQPVPVGQGTLPTHRPLFVGLLTSVVIVVAGLSYFPALALGPVAGGAGDVVADGAGCAERGRQSRKGTKTPAAAPRCTSPR